MLSKQGEFQLSHNPRKLFVLVEVVVVVRNVAFVVFIFVVVVAIVFFNKYKVLIDAYMQRLKVK